MADSKDEAIEIMAEALAFYRDPANWDGAGGWVNPSYSTEAAEITLEHAAAMLPDQLGKYAAKEPPRLTLVKGRSGASGR
jgi:hypothetical protein